MSEQKSIEIIAFDKNYIPEFQGCCKLVINCLSEMLSVEPKNEEFKIKSALFNWKFVAENNILFIFAEHDFMDFALIFGQEKMCKKVFDFIQKRKENASDISSEEMIFERFLNPIFNKKINDKSFKKFTVDWILNLDERKREKYMQLIKKCDKNDVDEFIQTINTIDVTHQNNNNNNRRNGRKRRHYEITLSYNETGDDSLDDKNNTNMTKKKQNTTDSPEYSKIIPSSQYKLVTVQTKWGYQKRLIIFTSSSEMSKCYEYTCKNQIYKCYECGKKRNRITAVLVYNEEVGDECVKLENQPHVCSPIPYQPEKYTEILVLKKPNYQIFENATTNTRKMLVIFHPKNRNLCYEYYWRTNSNTKFYCLGCRLKMKETAVEMYYEGKENEFIRLLQNRHVCEYRNYQPEKFSQFKDIVLKPDFEIQTKCKSGKERKTLIIFDKNDKSLCFKYYFDQRRQCYSCAKCVVKNKTVTAWLEKNSEDEEYIILSKAQHICELQKYIPTTNEVILRPPEISFGRTKDDQKIFHIFTTGEKKECYTFSANKKGAQLYKCRGCQNIWQSQWKTKNRKPSNFKTGKVVYAYLCKDEVTEDDNYYYVRMPPNQEHFCQPKKYIESEPERFSTVTLQSNDYFFFRQKCFKKDLLYLGIYEPKDRNLFFKYCYYSQTKLFVCNFCGNHQSHLRITAKIHQDSEGNEFIVANGIKHVCKPFKISSLKQQKGITFLDKSGLIIQQKPNPSKKKVIIDKAKILRKPNFELQRSVTGVKDKKLVVFLDVEDRSLCYTYFLNYNCYICSKCHKKKIRVQANLHIDEESGEKFIELGKNEHCCEPVKYEPEKNIIEESQFMVFNKDNKEKSTKLIIFTSSSSKEFCYEFYWEKKKQIFLCQPCTTQKKHVTAQILKNEENGQEFVQFFKNDHICSPKKFVLEEFQPKIFQKSGFFLCSNIYGKANAKMIVFDEEKKEEGEFCYEYHLKGNNLFICTKCCKQHHQNTSAKLSKDGEYLELFATKHLCKSIKFDATKYEAKEILSSSDRFALLHNKSGEPSKKLIIFDQNDKNFGYEYYFDKTPKQFICYQCRCSKPSKRTAAKLLIDYESSSGKESIELKHKHVCKILNLKEMNKIFETDEFKIDENEKVITVNHPNDKKLCYKFKFDEEISAFQCIQCKSEKKLCLTAKICKDKNEKEFLLLNGIHGCKPLRNK